MDVLPPFILKEVKYKLSDVLRGGVKVELPSEFDLKDPEVLLEQCEVCNSNFLISFIFVDYR